MEMPIKDISGLFIGWDYHNSNDGIDNEDGIVASCNRVEEDCQNVIEDLLNRGY